MVAIRERWFADDWEFTEGDIRDVEYRAGQLGTPPVRGSNATVANRTGEVWRPKRHEAGTFTLEVWLGTYQRQAQALWDELLRAVVQPHRLVTYRRITAAGETRYCQGEVMAALAPVPIGQSAYRASIEVHVPSGYWRGEALQTVTAPAVAGPAGTVVDLSVFSPSTAPLEELTVRLAGELSGAELTDITDRGRGDTLSYAASIPGGQSLTLDCANWLATPSPGWAAMTAPPSSLYNPAAINYSGDRFLNLAATPPGVKHQLLFTADTIGPGAEVTVSGYRSYLC